MATTIAPVTANNIKHCVLIDLNLDSNVYYLSGAYKTITYNSNNYTELGSFLQIDSIAEDIKTTNGDVAISLSGIPSEADYLSQVLSAPIKGGEVTVYRAFFGVDYTVDSANIFQRFKGIITNFAITENYDAQAKRNTNSITVTCASINTILENRITGQRTNPTDRQKFYPTDQTFNRVPDLHNVNFDFGREYTGGTGYGGGAGGGGRPGDFTLGRNFQFR